MLVLTRKVDERLVIGQKGHVQLGLKDDRNIVITVVEVRGGKVRIGIQAPREICVHREEVIQRINQELQQAGREDDDSRAAGQVE